MDMRRLIVIGLLAIGGSSSCGTTGGDVSGHIAFAVTTYGDMNRVSQNGLPDPSTLPFRAYAPVTAGSPVAVFVSKPGATPKGVVGVDFEYGPSSPYGAFRVREERRPPQPGDASQTRSMSRFCEDEDCTSKVIELGSGVQAALLYGPSGPTSTTWVERFGGRTYQVVVIGPKRTFSPGTALRIARQIASGFDPVGG